MAIINYKNHPKTTDTITFNLLTPGADGCLSANPYKVDNVKIFFVERGFADSNLQEYDKTVGNTDLEAKYTEAKKLACIDPTEDNILAAQAAKVKAESARVTNSFYYTSAIPVAVFGTPNFPAWLSSDTENAILENVPYDELGNTIYGNFKLTWTPKGGTKEGDYFVCWTWTPFPAGESISDNDYFDLVGDTVATTSIPSHATKEGKYELLLERYLPNIYKTSLCEGDLTSDTIEKLHTAIAGGFTQIENMANQVVDLYNADIVHESMLLLLSNMLGRKLRSEDPTLWRRQAANAISLFKKKGTHKGLSQALDEAGITLNKITKLWQVISPYTFQESFIVDNELDFYLENFPVLPVDGNYELYLRLENEEDYISIAVDNVEFSIVDSVSIMSWIGDQKSVNPISLAKGDELLVKYLIKEIPNGTQQTIENFIVTLPIADQRDARDQNYPLKNWNVRLIEEDDPLFDIIVPVHTQGGAYHDLLVFGMIRTEFPYSENIYNMESYNGCVTKNTTVFTENGLKKIKDLKNDKFILTEFGIKPFQDLKCHDKKPILKIKTKLGIELEVTENHRFKIIDQNGKIIWKEAKNLCVNDYILGKRGGSENILSNDVINKDWWYLAGFVYGDGFLQENKVYWLIPESEAESFVAIKNILTEAQAKFNFRIRTADSHRKNTHLSCNENMYIINSSRKQLPILAEILPTYKKNGKWKSKLPSTIWKAGEVQVCSFLSGIFDTDGSIQKGCPMLTTKWKNLAKEIQQLLLLLGIISSVTIIKTEYKGKKRSYYRVRIIGKDSIKLFIEKINFNLSRKKIALENSHYSTNIKGEEKKILSADRLVIPFANNIVNFIFPTRNSKSELSPFERSKEEKRILTLITRLKQNYQTTIPDNVVKDIYKKALLYGNVDNEYFEFIENYVNHGWFFDKVLKIESKNSEIVYDPFNVQETESYLSCGLVSHNSTRESNDPCDIDKDFLDPCDSCLSSSIIVDIEIEEISNNRIKEATEVIEEFIPFHTNVFRVNLAGQIEEFMTPPVEELEILVTFRVEEIVLAGNSNSYFHRVRDEGNISTNAITRDALATGVEVLSGVVGIAYNSEIVLYDYNINFKDLGINLNDHILQILAPSLNSGTYTITGINKNSLVVSGVTEPFNTSYFTYQILNKQLTTTNASIVQDDLFTFYDESLNFAQLGIQTIQESANWKIYVPAFSPSPFLVEDILPNGNLILRNHGSLPASSTYDISYTLLTDTDQEVENSTSGTLIVTKRGLVDINDINFQEPVGNVQSRLKFNDLFEVFGNQYPIIEFIDDQQFRIGNYSEGNAGGINAPIYRKLISHNTGIFDYSGMKLQCVGDHEFQFSILNGTNAPIDPDDITESDSFKENYLVVINDESYYKIVEWNGSTITLDGPKETWFTLDSGGTEVNYSLKHFTKNEITVDATTNLLDPPPHRFAFIDRRGNDMVEALLPDQTTSFIALSNTPGASLEETVSQQEGITYTIEYSDGRIVEGIIL